MLSKENRDKIIATGLYSCNPNVKYCGTLYTNNLYWCMNWTFHPYFSNDSVYMNDSYFNDKSILLTDENFNEFILIFDYQNVEETTHPEEYNREDVFHVAIDSGGYGHGHYFVKKGVKKSNKILIERCKDEIKACEYRLTSLKRELEQLEDGTHWKLREC